MANAPGRYIELAYSKAVRSIDGYEWHSSENDLNSVHLTQKGTTGISYDPFNIPTLFMQFAELNSDVPDSLLEFANKYGPLASSKIVRDGESLSQETLEFWQTQIRDMRNLINLWQWHETGNYLMLSKVISCGDPQSFCNGNAQFLQYFCSFNGEEPRPFFQQILSSQGEIIKDIQAAAVWLITIIVEAKLKEWTVWPVLHTSTPQGGFLQRFQPSSLLSTMWFQVFQALSGEKLFKRCSVCQKWEDVTNKKGTWKSHPECSSIERTRRFEAKKAREKNKLEKESKNEKENNL